MNGSFMIKVCNCNRIIGIGTGGIEPPTSSVSRKRSPTELRACPTHRLKDRKYSKIRAWEQKKGRGAEADCKERRHDEFLFHDFLL